jgi:transposase
MTVEEELFLQQILEDRDELYRETSRLKSQLSGYEDFATERASYESLIQEKDQAILKLKQQIRCSSGGYGGNPARNT